MILTYCSTHPNRGLSHLIRHSLILVGLRVNRNIALAIDYINTPGKRIAKPPHLSSIERFLRKPFFYDIPRFLKAI